MGTANRASGIAVAAILVFSALPAPAVAAPTGRIDVLVQFAAPPGPSDVALVRSLGGQVNRTFSIVPAMAASVPTAAVDALARNPRVTLVEPDSLVHALEYRPTHDWGIGHINAGLVHRATTPNTGAGVAVAVLDSGIDCDHLELPKDRCDYGQGIGENFVLGASHESANEADDDYGHGTHVAGTIAATLHGEAGGVVGVAPSARLVALKTLDSSGSGAWSRHIAAIEHVWNGGSPLVDIVNMSIGRGDYSSTAEQAMQRAYDAGILLVASAGNSGKCSGRGTNIAYPALFESVIAVAAVDSSNARPCWSSTGDKVELAAPGVSVFSTWPANMPTSYRDPQPVCDDGDGDGLGDCHYKYGSGTSMSSPHVAGTAALIIASGTLSDGNANGLADEVRTRLAATAVDIGTAGRDAQFGFGVVDAAAAAGETGGGASNSAPAAVFSASCSQLACAFDGSASADPDGSVVAYAWDFGDGTTGSGATASHTYAAGAAYRVTLTVTDDDGATDTHAESITVASDSSGAITLTVTAYKVRGRQHADLAWSGANATAIDVWREGALVATVPNSGSYTDVIGAVGGGSYAYVVCEAGTATCSEAVTASY